MSMEKEKKAKDPLYACVDRAKDLNHKFIIKIGSLTSNNYQSRTSGLIYYLKEFQFLPEEEHPEAYEALFRDNEAMFYLDCEKIFSERPSSTQVQFYVSKTMELVKTATGIQPVAITLDNSRFLDKAMSVWKLSLHFIFQTIKTKNLPQAENVYLRIVELGSQDEKWNQEMFFVEIDKKGKPKTKCLYDGSVYSDAQLMRLPGSYKTEYDFVKKKKIIKGTPFQILNTPFHPHGMGFGLNEITFSNCCISNTNDRPGCVAAQFVSDQEFPLFRTGENTKTISKKNTRKEIKQKLSHDQDPQPERQKNECIGICYAILRHQFPNGGDKTSTLQEMDPGRKYRIHNHGGLYCGYGAHHDSVGGCFYVRTDHIDYYCYAEGCKSKPPVKFTHERLKEIPKNVQSIPQAVLEAEQEISEDLFQKVAVVYRKQLDEKKIERNKPIEEKDLEWAQQLAQMWRQDINAVINRFIIRCTDGQHQLVVLSWKKTKYGFIQRKVEPLLAKDIKNAFHDYHFSLPTILIRGKAKVSVWTEEFTSLSDYLYGGKGNKMSKSEKVTCEGVEFYPATLEQDTRSPHERGTKINTFSGLQIPPEYAVAWYHELSDQDKARAQKDMKIIRGHLENIICSGNGREADYLEKYYKLVYTKPWQKLDVHHMITGDQGVGKTLFLAWFFLQILGDDYCLVVKNVDHLNKNFNAILTNKLLIINEEVLNPASHAMASFLKAFLDSNSQWTENQKFKAEKVVQTFWKCIFISNEHWAYNVGTNERRSFVTKAQDNGYIQSVCAAHGWSERAEYFNYLQGIDPRTFAYYLTQVDISQFDPRRDFFVTQETGVQKQLSLGKQSIRMAFWSEFFQNRLHYHDDQKKEFKKTNIRGVVENFIVHTLATLNQSPDKHPPLSKVLADLKGVLVENDTKPYWIFQPTPSDWERIRNHFEELIRVTDTKENPYSSEQWETMKTVCKRKDFKVSRKSVVPKENKSRDAPFGENELNDLRRSVADCLGPVERENYSYFRPGWFNMRRFYTEYLMPYQTNKRIFDETSKYDYRLFWKETFEKTFPRSILLQKRTKSERLFQFPCLKVMKDHFAKNVIKKPDYFAVESVVDSHVNKKRKLVSE